MWCDLTNLRYSVAALDFFSNGVATWTLQIPPPTQHRLSPPQACVGSKGSRGFCLLFVFGSFNDHGREKRQVNAQMTSSSCFAILFSTTCPHSPFCFKLPEHFKIYHLSLQSEELKDLTWPTPPSLFPGKPKETASHLLACTLVVRTRLPSRVDK